VLINFSTIKKVYIIGIKGSGVVGVAQILNQKGKEVLGSDTQEKFFTDEILKEEGIQYFEKFSPSNVPADADLVIYSTAYNEENNVEFKKAKEEGFLMASYPEVLGALFEEKYGIAVAGTHGKTTTSALLAHVLEKCGTDPSAVIGSRVTKWQGSALAGQGEYFVIEADEYQNKFQYYNPKAIILTSLDFDHPDFFADFREYKKVFIDFVMKLPAGGFLVVWGDSTDTLEVATNCKAKVISYGLGPENDFRISNIQTTSKEQFFEVSLKNKFLGKFKINLFGKHNVLNATAVIATCHRLGMDLEKVREALGNFQGTARRFEYIGEQNGAILIDDYGHHPEELKATLKAAREIYPEKNIWAVFHPHSFSRTEALLQDFSQSFADANKVIVLDIYGSARENKGNISSEDLVKLINKYDRDKAQHIATIPEVVEFLQDKIGENDVVITIGAGNVFEVAQKLKEK